MDGREVGVVGRMSRKAERDAWTAFVDGKQAQKSSKYGAVREGKYASKHEAAVARKLWVLADREAITDLKEQVKFTLVPGDGKLRPIIYIADFTWLEDGSAVVADAKGFKTPVYRLKKRIMKLLLGIDIREL
jgi:hypothetical protein